MNFVDLKARVHNALLRSSWLQHGYGRCAERWARHLVARNRRYEALETLCNAWHRIEEGEVDAMLLHAIRGLVADEHGKVRLQGRENLLLNDDAWQKRSHSMRQLLSERQVCERVRLRIPRSDPCDSERQGNLIVLKCPADHGQERGVILLKYNPTFEEFHALFDCERLARRYHIVLEPSSFRNADPTWGLFISAGAQVTVQCAHSADARFCTSAAVGLHQIPLGAGDWVDSDEFVPDGGNAKHYDVVMVASWSRIKRHEVLLRALVKLRPRQLKVALVGYPADRNASDIRRMFEAAGMAITICENIPPGEVRKVVADSKVAVHLSEREGANKACYEALFCNTPILVHAGNVGFRMATITPETGMVAMDEELPRTIAWMIDNVQSFSPRRWAMANTGYQNATRILNEHLRNVAHANHEPWTRDIVPKVNKPNLRYKHPYHRQAMEPAYRELEMYLR